MKYVIFGDGLAAASLLYLLRRNGHQVVNVRLDAEPGGSLVDSYEDGVYIPKYGPHYLHTDNPEVIQLLEELAHFEDCHEYTCTRINYRGEEKDVNGNMSYSTLRDIYGLDTYNKSTYIWLSRDSSRSTDKRHLDYPKIIYDLVIKDYTNKCWVGSDMDLVYEKVIQRLPFTHKFLPYKNESTYNKVPIEGWSHVITNMLTSFSGEVVRIMRDEVNETVRMFYNQPQTKVIYCYPVDLLVNTGAAFYTRSFSKRYKVEGESYKSASTYITDPKSDVVRVVDIDLLSQNRNHLPSGLVLEERVKIATEFDLYVNPVMTKENLYKVNLGKNTIRSRYPELIMSGRVTKSTYSNMDDVIESAINTYQYLTRSSWK